MNIGLIEAFRPPSRGVAEFVVRRDRKAPRAGPVQTGPRPDPPQEMSNPAPSLCKAASGDVG